LIRQEQGPRFKRYEKQFGKIHNSKRAEVLALFSLIEYELTFDQNQRQAYEASKLAQRRAERQEARVKRSPEEADGVAQETHY